MFGYATDLRSATQGHANDSMLFDSYDAWELRQTVLFVARPPLRSAPRFV